MTDIVDIAHPVPEEALDDRLGIIGTSGGGKTYSSIGCAERIMCFGGRVIVVDPLDAWWGLRVMQDGHTPSGIDIVIIGGDHADLPLTEAAGAVIGAAVARARESFIISTKRLPTVAAERRFMRAFLESLWENANREPVHVIFDEADMWAPQRILDHDGGATALLGLMNKIVRRGRLSGFISWLITQRPAEISKSILSMMDGLLAFRTTSPHDRDQLEDWVKGRATKEQWDKIYSGLPSLQTGEGVVWLPLRGVLETKMFPEKSTFDSSRTPRRGEQHIVADLRPLDVRALAEQLAEVEAEDAEDDVEELRKQIKDLRKQLATVQKPAVDQASIDQAREEGYRAGSQAMRVIAVEALNQADSSIREAELTVQNAQKYSDSMRAAASAPPPSFTVTKNLIRKTPDDGVLYKGARDLLVVIARQGIERKTWKEIAIMAAMQSRGGHWNTSIRALREHGLVDENPEGIVATAAGIERVGSPPAAPTRVELIEMWKQKLPTPGAEMLSYLATRPGKKVTKKELAEALGKADRGGSWNTGIASLRDSGLVEIDGPSLFLCNVLRDAR